MVYTIHLNLLKITRVCYPGFFVVYYNPTSRKKMPKQTKLNNRENWGHKYSALPKLDLLAVQKESYKWFQETAIGDILQEVSPIDDFTEKNWSLSFSDYRFGKPSTSPQTAITKGITYDAPLYVKAMLLNKKTEK